MINRPDVILRLDRREAIEATNTSHTLGPLVPGPPCCVPKTLIGVENLSLSYGGKPALRDISLDIYRGCITALVGPSGCGKTSFLSALNRLTDLIPGCEVSGRVQIGGVDVRDPALDVGALRRRVGMIFQRPAPFPLSIRRNIEMPLKEHGVRGRAELAGRTKRALTDVGLWAEVKDRLDAPALALSGGQQQRLCIARALALEPSVLLMDEPCSALDPLSSGVVEDLIVSLRGRITVVIVTHNLAQARRIANFAAFFWVHERAGTLVEFGHCRGVKETADALAAALEAKGVKVFARIDHAAGAKAAGMELRPTEVIIFGNPKLGTPLMQADQRAGIDLPMKALVWQDADGKVFIGYTDPAALKDRYRIEGKDDVLKAMAQGLDAFSASAAGK